MNQNTSGKWAKVDLLAFRFFFTYVVLYFMFMEDFILSKFSWLALLRRPFTFLSKTFIEFVSSNIKWINYFAYVDILLYLTLTVIITLVWTALDKRKNYAVLFKCLHASARYYIAFALLSYGLWKITWLQMPPPWPSWLVVPLGELRPSILFWNFMGASKSYQFFSGLMELIPAVLLLFRRTSTLGALIATGALLNVLMLNIGYEVAVIPFIIHLLLMSLLIVSPDLKRLHNIFVAHKTELLPVMPTAFEQNRYKWLGYGVKLSLITYVMIFDVREINEVRVQRYGNLAFYSLHGIYNVTEYYHNQQHLAPLITDSTRWNKLVIDGAGGAKVLYMNNSSEYYDNIEVDTTAQLLEFYNDNTNKNKLHYTLTKTNQYIFDGVYKNDSIYFIADKVDLTNLPLFKNRNKVKWTW